MNYFSLKEWSIMGDKLKNKLKKKNSNKNKQIEIEPIDTIEPEPKYVSSIPVDPNTTSGRSFPLRLTDIEKGQLQILADKLQELVPNKKISRSRVLRASVYVQDSISLKKLARSIVDNT